MSKFSICPRYNKAQRSSVALVACVGLDEVHHLERLDGALLDTAGDRETGVAHQVNVDLAGGLAAFVDAPDDEGLSSSAICGNWDEGQEIRP
jgi:hypothetical protein